MIHIPHSSEICEMATIHRSLSVFPYHTLSRDVVNMLFPCLLQLIEKTLLGLILRSDLLKNLIIVLWAVVLINSLNELCRKIPERKKIS